MACRILIIIVVICCIGSKFNVTDVITSEEADTLVKISEEIGYRPEAPGIQTPPGMRMNKALHWLCCPQIMDEIFRRIQPLLPQELDGARLVPRLSYRMNMYKYDDGDVFNTHVDGDWPGYGLSDDGTRMVEWEGCRSKLR